MRENSNEVSRSSFLKSALLIGTTISMKASPSEAASATKRESVEGKKNVLWNISQNLSKSVTESQTLQEAMSGLAAGSTISITKTLLKYPLDTATVRLQMPGRGASYYQNDLSALFSGAFRGIAAPLVANVPAGAVFFAVKDAAKSSMRDSGLPRWATTALAVALALPPYWLVRNPTEVVKTRQQAGLDGYADINVLDAYKAVYREGNLTAFYSGYRENVLYAFPADVTKFLCYEALSRGTNNLSPAQGALYGALSTAIAQFLTTPLDVIRNRVMTDTLRTDKPNATYFDEFYYLATNDGLNALFAGLTPRIAKALLTGAIQFATYEETKLSIARFFQRTLSPSHTD